MSDGDDSIVSIEEPAMVASIRRQQQQYANYISQTTIDVASTNPLMQTDLCGTRYPVSEAVPLVNLSDMSFPWFDMFVCWLETLAVPKITFDFKFAQGPVLSESWMQNFVDDPAGVVSYYV